MSEWLILIKIKIFEDPSIDVGPLAQRLLINFVTPFQTKNLDKNEWYKFITCFKLCCWNLHKWKNAFLFLAQFMYLYKW